jgi:hypothetical protein
MEAAVARPYRKPEHWLRRSSAGTNLGGLRSAKPSFSWRYTPEPGNACSGDRVANTIMSMSPFSSPASSMAMRLASTARSADPMPSSANRRSSMPVRFTIHSWLVSMPYSSTS